MKEITLIVGGCKSGKSNHALATAEKYGQRQFFFATCVPCDHEMQDRVARHQQERGNRWRTIEVPMDLPGALAGHGNEGNVILVDCLTLWITNLLMKNETREAVEVSLQRLVTALGLVSCPVVLVANEVGCGIVPENRLARLFRDLAGMANQKIAAVADHVVWTVAGIPVKIK